MPRPRKCRHISCAPGVTYYKPAGIPLRELEEITLEADEVEAMNLTDLQELYQEEAAGRMGISRATLSGIVKSARKKVAKALMEGLAIRILTTPDSQEEL